MSKWTLRLYILPAAFGVGILGNALFLTAVFSKAGQWQRFLAGQSDIYLDITVGALIVSVVATSAYAWAIAAEYRKSGGWG